MSRRRSLPCNISGPLAGAMLVLIAASFLIAVG